MKTVYGTCVVTPYGAGALLPWDQKIDQYTTAGFELFQTVEEIVVTLSSGELRQSCVRSFRCYNESRFFEKFTFRFFNRDAINDFKNHFITPILSNNDATFHGDDFVISEENESFRKFLDDFHMFIEMSSLI